MKKYLNKDFLIPVACFFSYFFIFDIISKIFDSIFFILKLEGIYYQIYCIIKYSIFPIILFILFKKELLSSLKKLKNKILDYLPDIIIPYIIGFIVMIISNIILNYVFKLGISANEQQLNEIYSKYSVYLFFVSCLFGPFIEEIIFRFCLRKMIRNNKLYIILSGLIFGLLHVVFSMTSPLEFLYIIPYSALGTAFAYTYVKTDNIWTTIGVHAIHNTCISILKMMV